MNLNLKQGFIILICFSCLVGSAFADEDRKGISFSTESLNDGSAWSLGVYSKSFDVFYAGLSINKVTSPTLVDYRKTETVSPLFFFLGLKAPWKISPFIEGGMDFVELIADDITKSDDEESSDYIDYYFSGGIKYSINNRFTVSLYAKEYVIKYRNVLNTQMMKSKPSGYGVGISMLF